MAVFSISPLLSFDVTLILSRPAGFLSMESGVPVPPRDFIVVGDGVISPSIPAGFSVADPVTPPSVPSGVSFENLDFVAVPRGFFLEGV